MPDPATLAGYKASTLVSMGAGATVAGLLLGGRWWERLIAGAAGGLFAFVATPLFAPLLQAGWAWAYAQLGLPPTAVEHEAVAGFTGFVLGLTGIDICRFIMDRTKGGLSTLKLPLGRSKPMK